MRALVPAIGSLCLLAGNPAASEEYIQTPYVGLSLGYLALNNIDGEAGGSDLDIKYDDAFDIALQIGFKTWIWRVEAELEYAQSEYESIDVDGTRFNADGDFDVLRMTGSLYYDFDNLSRYTPYMGGGVGFASVDVDDTVVGAVTVEGDSDTHFTMHGEFGLSVALNEQVALVPAYRFLWLNTSSSGFDDNTGHLFKAGLRYLF